MFAVLSSFEVENKMEEAVKDAFRNRPRLVENFEGFIRLEVLCPTKNPAEIWLLTYWKDEESFQFWHKHHLKDSHHGIPKGLKLVPHSFKLQYFTIVAA